MENTHFNTCCFFGHRKIEPSQALKARLYKAIEILITEKKVSLFLFGSKSQFDTLCHTIVTQLKEKYTYLERVYVRAEFPYIDDRYKQYLLKSYEDTYYPEKILEAGKAVYIERNYEMINMSHFCIIYYDKNYMPPKRKQSKSQMAFYQSNSGTQLAYDYAVKKGLEVINVFT